MPSCWHHISRRLRGEGEWLHVAGLLLQGGVGLTSAVHLSDPNLGLVPVPLSFPSSTANSTVRRGVKAPQQPCLRKGNRKAPLPLCLWTAAPSPRLLGALSSSGCCEDTGKRPGLGRRPRWAGRKTCFHATPSKVVWKQKEQKTRPYSHGWNVSPGVSALGLGCRLTHNAAPGPRRLETSSCTSAGPWIPVLPSSSGGISADLPTFSPLYKPEHTAKRYTRPLGRAVRAT